MTNFVSKNSAPCPRCNKTAPYFRALFSHEAKTSTYSYRCECGHTFDVKYGSIDTGYESKSSVCTVKTSESKKETVEDSDITYQWLDCNLCYKKHHSAVLGKLTSKEVPCPECWDRKTK